MESPPKKKRLLDSQPPRETGDVQFDRLVQSVKMHKMHAEVRAETPSDATAEQKFRESWKEVIAAADEYTLRPRMVSIPAPIWTEAELEAFANLRAEIRRTELSIQEIGKENAHRKHRDKILRLSQALPFPEVDKKTGDSPSTWHEATSNYLPSWKPQSYTQLDPKHPSYDPLADDGEDPDISPNLPPIPAFPEDVQLQNRTFEDIVASLPTFNYSNEHGDGDEDEGYEDASDIRSS